MLMMNDLVADAATAIALGRRQRQEDAVVTDFSQGAEMGLAVLSDGMGGHSAGDLASRIIVAEIFGELFYCSAEIDQLRTHPTSILQSAVSSANHSLRAHAEARSGRNGMGGTLVATVFMDDGLRWVSVGDSPLYLFRDGELHRLNEDHSMAPQIDHMAREGIIDAELARNHPQRGCLTSALTGGNIDKVDCPDDALALKEDDIVVIASDGLQVLPDHEIQRIVGANRHRASQVVTGALMEAVRAADAPHQDNVSVAVIKLDAYAAAAPGRVSNGAGDFASALIANGRRLLSPVRQAFRQGKGGSVL